MVLLVAATEAELCSRAGLVCGVGPVEAAAATAARLAAGSIAGVVHVGVAGGPEVGGLVIGTEALYADLDAEWPVVRSAQPDGKLLAAARAALPGARACPIVTSAAVGTAGAGTVEAMEGFGVLRAAALAGVPAVEVRAVSNTVGEADRSRWRVAEALAALETAIPALLDAADAALRARGS